MLPLLIVEEFDVRVLEPERFPLLDVLFPIVDLVRVRVALLLAEVDVLELLVAFDVLDVAFERVLVELLVATEFLL